MENLSTACQLVWVVAASEAANHRTCPEGVRAFAAVLPGCGAWLDSKGAQTAEFVYKANMFLKDVHSLY